LDRDPQFGSLRLTVKGFAVLHGTEKFLVPEQPMPVPAGPALSGPADPDLLQKLKVLRTRLASTARVPAYVIFSDRSLVEMAQQLPRSEVQFLGIHGVGDLKLANYGRQFLDVICQHCDFSSNITVPAVPTRTAQIARLPGSRSQEISALFVAGQSIQQIASALQIQPGTVVQNLYRFQETGGKLDPERVLSESKLPAPQQAQAFELLRRLGIDRLAPVHAALGGLVPYEELHLLRLYWICKGAS
jgi:ATP-dependent DNA helicase RecQ